MATATQPTETVEQRLATLEKEFFELRASVLGLNTREKDWRRTIGAMPDDEISRSAVQLGREWREQANKAGAMQMEACDRIRTVRAG